LTPEGELGRVPLRVAFKIDKNALQKKKKAMVRLGGWRFLSHQEVDDRDIGRAVRCIPRS
jgi:hypothetical protein